MTQYLSHLLYQNSFKKGSQSTKHIDSIRLKAVLVQANILPLFIDKGKAFPDLNVSTRIFSTHPPLCIYVFTINQYSVEEDSGRGGERLLKAGGKISFKAVERGTGWCGNEPRKGVTQSPRCLFQLSATAQDFDAKQRSGSPTKRKSGHPGIQGERQRSGPSPELPLNVQHWKQVRNKQMNQIPVAGGRKETRNVLNRNPVK